MRLRGERQFQTVVCAVLLKLAKALNKSISYLVDEKEPSREIELVK